MAESTETYCSLYEKYSCCIVTRYTYISETLKEKSEKQPSKLTEMCLLRTPYTVTAETR